MVALAPHTDSGTWLSRRVLLHDPAARSFRVQLAIIIERLAADDHGVRELDIHDAAEALQCDVSLVIIELIRMRTERLIHAELTGSPAELTAAALITPRITGGLPAIIGTMCNHFGPRPEAPAA